MGERYNYPSFTSMYEVAVLLRLAVRDMGVMTGAAAPEVPREAEAVASARSTKE